MHEAKYQNPLRNPRHEAFAQACLTMSRSDAYRSVYPNSNTWKDASVHTRASNLYVEVERRVEWLKAQAAKAAVKGHEECCIALSNMIQAVCDAGENGTYAPGNELAWEVETIESGDGATITKRKMRDIVALIHRLSQMMGYDKPKKFDVRKQGGQRPLKDIPTEVLIKAVENMAAEGATGAE